MGAIAEELLMPELMGSLKTVVQQQEDPVVLAESRAIAIEVRVS
jgi:hypothetical protein